MVTKRIISIGWWPTCIHSDQQYPNFSKLVPKDYYGQPHAGAGAINLSIYLSIPEKKDTEAFLFQATVYIKKLDITNTVGNRSLAIAS